MWFLCLIGFIVLLVIDYLVAQKFEEIAEMKGHEGGTYFWFTFFLGIVGMLMVIALPVQTKGEGHKTTTLPPPKDIFAKAKENASANTVKRCRYCGDVVKSGRCEMCGREDW